uniref:Uncharacterized protein n=1 Tax=Oryza nivara TaxID=4536 RepID=A0A0E0HAN4_ORYNI
MTGGARRQAAAATGGRPRLRGATCGAEGRHASATSNTRWHGRRAQHARGKMNRNGQRLMVAAFDTAWASRLMR